MLPELEPRLAEFSRGLFAGTRELLAVGVRLAHASVCVAAPSDAAGLGRRFDACLWLFSGDAHGSPRWGLGLLRPLLRPSARLLLAAPLRAPALAQLRALLSGARAPVPPSLESLCDALLLQGFCAPRVHTQLAAWRLVSAELPSVPSSLDAFFEQPAQAPHR